jgi:hypothetical protein
MAKERSRENLVARLRELRSNGAIWWCNSQANKRSVYGMVSEHDPVYRPSKMNSGTWWCAGAAQSLARHHRRDLDP